VCGIATARSHGKSQNSDSRNATATPGRRPEQPRLLGFLVRLSPGSDDDPSGIATIRKPDQLGFAIGWTMLSAIR